MPSESYAVRITLRPDLVQPYLDVVALHCSSVVAYNHSDNPENDHVHIFIHEAKVSKERLKQLAAPHFTGKGNQFWSWKKADDNWAMYLTYMSKGKLEPFYIKGNIDPDTCEKQRLKWVTPKAKVTPGHQAYLEFVKRMDNAGKIEQWLPGDYEKIVHLAAYHCRAKHGYYSAACNQQIANYSYTYCKDNGVIVPKEKRKF